MSHEKSAAPDADAAANMLMVLLDESDSREPEWHAESYPEYDAGSFTLHHESGAIFAVQIERIK